MLWLRESLFTNVTWPPALIVTVAGLTPLEVIVIVAVEGAGPPGVGEVVEAPEQPIAPRARATARGTANLVHMTT